MIEPDNEQSHTLKGSITDSEDGLRELVDSTASRYEHLKLKHDGFKIVMEKGFREQATAGYPIYQQLLFAPFVVEDDARSAMQAGVPITFTKAEWIRKSVVMYERKKAEAMNRLMDWVDAMVVPLKAGGEDQVKVRYWGPKREEDEGPRIQLTDLE